MTTPLFTMKTPPLVRAALEAEAARRGLSMAAVLRLGVERLADENLPIDDSRPADTGRKNNHSTDEETVDVLQAYP